MFIMALEMGKLRSKRNSYRSSGHWSYGVVSGILRNIKLPEETDGTSVAFTQFWQLCEGSEVANRTSPTLIMVTARHSGDKPGEVVF